MPQRHGQSIAVVGAANWTDVAAGLLRRAGLNAEVIRGAHRWVPLRMPISRRFLAARVAHIVWGGDVRASIVAGWLLRKRLVWHWIGSDVLHYKRGRGVMQVLRRRLALRHVDLHLADSPELADELKSLNIDATVCRLLPASIEAEILPLPDRFRVLSYWFDDRRAFYGGDLILELARQMPDVEFLIAGAGGKGVARPANVTFLGTLADMEPVYRQIAVFLRLPEHDSLSAMVLESLARGRYVIYNKDFPCCRPARTLEEVRAALDELRRSSEPNREGAEFVRASFSLQNEADTLRRIYDRILPVDETA